MSVPSNSRLAVREGKLSRQRFTISSSLGAGPGERNSDQIAYPTGSTGALSPGARPHDDHSRQTIAREIAWAEKIERGASVRKVGYFKYLFSAKSR